MSELQPMPPPPGGDQNRGPDTYGANIPTAILSTGFVLARMYVRIFVIHNVGWDDHTIVLAQVMNILNLIFQILAVRNGLGRHMYYLSFQNIVKVGLYFHIIEILYILTSAVVKISACLFFLRIMARGKTKTLRRSLYILMGIIILLCVATILVILLQCIPIQAGWDPRVKGKCWSYSQILGIGYAQSVWAIVSDIVCAGFPVIILRNLKINKRNKYGLLFIMGLGLLSAICGLIKIIYLGDLKKGDFTYNGANLNLWGVIETNIGTIACCIPALQPLFKFLSQRSGSSAKENSRKSAVIGSWRNSSTIKPGLHTRSFHNINNDTSSDREQILSAEGSAGIRKTTDVELYFHENRGNLRANDGSIEMV